MKAKDESVETQFHPIITQFLFTADIWYSAVGGHLVITSGSEQDTRHGVTSLHYATPCCAADLRSWDIRWNNRKFTAVDQHAALVLIAADVCETLDIPTDWIEVILEGDHIHVEYQPKRLEGV